MYLNPRIAYSCLTAPLFEKKIWCIHLSWFWQWINFKDCENLFTIWIDFSLQLHTVFESAWLSSPSCLLDACRWASVISTLCLVKSLSSKQKCGNAPAHCWASSRLTGEYYIRSKWTKKFSGRKCKEKRSPVWDFNYGLFSSCTFVSLIEVQD